MTRVAVIGTGVIGESWARLFLAHGHEVVAADPAPGARHRLPDGVRFVDDPADAVAGADFVQENGPERLEVKHALLAELDAAAPPGVVIASSSSALRRAASSRPATIVGSVTPRAVSRSTSAVTASGSVVMILMSMPRARQLRVTVSASAM